MTAQDAKTYRLSDFVILCFFLIFGTKRKHTVLSNSESAKDLVRISVLEEKLDLWWKLQFAAQDAKTYRLSVFVIFCFFSIFGTKRKHTSPTSSESAKELVRISVLAEKLQHPATKCYSSCPVFRPTSIDAGWCTRPS